MGESARLTVNLNDQIISSWIITKNCIEIQRTELQQCIERLWTNGEHTMREYLPESRWQEFGPLSWTGEKEADQRSPFGV